MESDGKGHLRQQENCILRGEKGKFCGTNWTTHHFDAAANWIEGEFSSILRLTTQAEPRRTNDVNRESGTESAIPALALAPCSAVPRELEIEVPSTLRSGIEPEHS